MFCSTCGKDNPDTARFCEGCGAALEAATPAPAYTSPDAPSAPTYPDYAPTASAGNPLFKILPIILVAGIVVAVAVVVLILFLSTSGAERTLEKYYDAYAEGDGETAYELRYNPYMIEYAIDEYDYDDKADHKEKLLDSFEEEHDDLEDEFGQNTEITEFEITGIRKYDPDEVETIAEYLNDKFDYPKSSVEDICVIKFRCTVTGDDDYEIYNDMESVMIKLDGDWYVGSNGLYSAEGIDNILYDVFD